MSENTFVCARLECDVIATRKTHNQKYCTDECCRLATNKRIMEKYHEGRARKLGKVRYCKSCMVTKLSRYNENPVCNSCRTKNFAETNNTVLTMVLSATGAA